jgi:hypothetical protein
MWTGKTEQMFRWAYPNATFYIDPATVKGKFSSEFQMALQAWSGQTGSAWRYSFGGSTPSAQVGVFNTVSEAFFTSEFLGPDIIGMCSYGYDSPAYTTGVIEYADVYFNSKDHTWTPYGDKTALDFRTVAIHELGHALGLGHSTVTDAVMYMNKGVTPERVQWSLAADDIEGLKFLYPISGGTPVPGKDGPDICVDSVTVEPAGARPGDKVLVSCGVRNAGTRSSGSFNARLCLTGAPWPLPGDPVLDAQAVSTMPWLQTRTLTFSTAVPSGLLPGAWRFGLLADPEGVVPDIDRANNGGSSAPIVVERAPIEISPGDDVEADLGPYGVDTTTVFLFSGARLRLRATGDDGLRRIRLMRPGDGRPVGSSRLGRTVKLDVRVADEGDYSIELKSEQATTSSYALETRARSQTFRETRDVAGAATVPVRVYAGSRVKVKVRAGGGLRMDATLGAEAPKESGGGTRYAFGPFTPSATGYLVLRVAPREGTAGTVSVVTKVKPPRQGAVHVR